MTYTNIFISGFKGWRQETQRIRWTSGQNISARLRLWLPLSVKVRAFYIPSQMWLDVYLWLSWFVLVQLIYPHVQIIMIMII